MTYDIEPKIKSIRSLSDAWKERTLLEKVLIILYLVIGTSIIASIVLFYLLFSDKIFDRKSFCETPECISAAASMLNRMDRSVEPCNDFYDFACGKFVKETLATMPDDKLTVDMFSIVSDRIEIQIKTILNKPIESKDLKTFQLAKRLYASCMNRAIVENLGLTPMNNILNSLGGWPVVMGNNWKNNEFDLIEMVKKMREIGLSTSYLFSLAIGTNSRNSSTQIFQLDQPSLGLNRHFLLNDKEKSSKQYYDFMVDIAKLFGANETTVAQEMNDTINFEIFLANISVPNAERRNGESQYNPFTIQELQIRYPYIQWFNYINSLVPKNLNLTDKEVIVVISPIYFEHLKNVLETTPKRTIANYMIWRSILMTSTFLNSAVRSRKNIYHLSQQNQDAGETYTPLWKECVSYTASTLSISVGALYVRHYFNENARKRVNEMVNDVKSAYISIIENNVWMDELTKRAALDKAHALTAHIAYPDELIDDKKIEEYYAELNLQSDEYLMNALKLNKFKINYGFQQLRKPNNKTNWIQHASSAVNNAFYSLYENSIQFPAGILQEHFLTVNRPEYLNYASIGQIIGHEISHAFDDEGRQYDSNGNLIDWWHSDAAEHFLNRSKCFVDQYSNFTDPITQLKLNGIQTQGENIADSVGVKSAYLAYTKWMMRHGKEKRLSGLHFTPQQLFWISAAQTWCSAPREWYTKLMISIDPHAIGRFRVLGPLKNNLQFAKDFQCELGSVMNPKEKCEVW